MTIRGIFATRPATLRSRIQELQSRIDRRQDRVGSNARDVARKTRDQLITPFALISAGLLGVALHRGNRLTGLRIIALLESANVGLQHLLVTTSRPSAPPK